MSRVILFHLFDKAGREHRLTPVMVMARAGQGDMWREPYEGLRVEAMCLTIP